MKTISLFCLSILVAQASWSQMNEVMGKYLTDRTMGSDPFYGKVVAPALNLETSKARFERIAEANSIMVSELDMMSYSFSITPTETLVSHMYDVVKIVDPAVIGHGGNIIFSGTNPSLATTRNLILIQKSKAKVADPAAALMKTLTSYKHSAKPNDFVYEYSDATNLTSSKVVSSVGSDSSWMGAEAAPAFNENQDYVLKKCRQLLGWRCITSLYRTETLTDGLNHAQILFISLYDLTLNKDHADFAGDKRSMNQITGSTAMYIVKETADYVMLYGIDSQYNNDKASFTGAILSEFQKDMARFKQRISTDLGIAVKDIQ